MLSDLREDHEEIGFKPKLLDDFEFERRKKGSVLAFWCVLRTSLFANVGRWRALRLRGLLLLGLRVVLPVARHILQSRPLLRRAVIPALLVSPLVHGDFCFGLFGLCFEPSTSLCSEN
jgi:hypothetical protein